MKMTFALGVSCLAWGAAAASAAGEAKVTFLGDLLCEGPMLEAHATEKGWDFGPTFAGLKPLLAASDYVVANLETPISDVDENLTHERWCFCSPRAFAAAVKDAGVDFVFTANNHCLDRGPEGVRATIRALDALGLPHTGTFADPAAADRPTVVEVKGFRLGILSYTYGSNAFSNNQYLKPEESHLVNFFQDQELAEPLARKWMWNRSCPEARLYEEMERRRWPENLTLPVYERVASNAVQRAKFRRDVERVRALKPDFTVVGMHTGGQRNPEATKWTKELTGFILGCGADVVVGTHEHVVHGFDFSRLGEGKAAVYCLGDCVSQHERKNPPAADPLFATCSVAWHLHLARDSRGRARIARTSFSVLKITAGARKGRVSVAPLHDLWAAETDPAEKAALAAELRGAAARFTGRDCSQLPVRPEYFVDAAGAIVEGGVWQTAADVL